jgi:hypothetical protein
MTRTQYLMLAAALIAVTSRPASAQLGTSCVTQAEAETVIIFALPAIIKTVARQCAPHLPGTAALTQSAMLIAARYQPQSDQAWDEAAIAIDKMMGLPLAKAMGAEKANVFIAPLLTREVAKAVKAENCDSANRFINALQPLPARNVAALLMVLTQAAAERKPASLPIKICPLQVAGQ